MMDILLPAFLVSLVLLGIHSYFGLRIIERNIIFTDLAIGQMAAFGAALSLLLLDGGRMYLISLAFALFTGLLIALASRRSGHPEAMIGLLYAMGLSGVFIVLSRSPHGTEEFQRLMAYDIIFTPLRDIWPVALLYTGLGGVIYLSNRLLRGLASELVFFITFALTVTSSVKLAGVLVVFSILLAPAFISMRIADMSGHESFPARHRLLTAWITGTVINMAAIFLSFRMDLPTGYSLVFGNSMAALVAGFAGKNKKQNS
jgi:zinc/manganese transport system permease protein